MTSTIETEDALQHQLAQIIDDVIWPLAEWDGDRLKASSAAGKAAAAVLAATPIERLREENARLRDAVAAMVLEHDAGGITLATMRESRAALNQQ